MEVAPVGDFLNAFGGEKEKYLSQSTQRTRRKDLKQKSSVNSVSIVRDIFNEFLVCPLFLTP
jgi:hypothetical protein